MPTIKISEKCMKSFLKCEKKRGWKYEDALNIIKILETRPFTQEELIKYHDHALTGNKRGHREFHPYGHRHNWVVLYHVEGSSVVLDDSTVVFDDTGTHDEVLGQFETETQLIFI